MSLSKDDDPLGGLNQSGTVLLDRKASTQGLQASLNRRIELLEYLYLVQLYDEFKSACSIRQLFDSLPRSEHLQNQPDSSVSCRK